MPTATPAPTVPQPTTPQPAADGARQSFDFGKPVHAIAWNADGKTLAIGGEGGQVALWEPATNQAPRVTEAFAGCTSLAFSASGRTLAIGTAGGEVLIWNVTTGKAERSLKHADLSDVRAAVWTQGSSDPLVAIGDDGGAVRLFSASSGTQQAVLGLASEAGPVQALARGSKSPPLLFAAHLDGTVALWNVAGKNIVKILAPSGAPLLDKLNKDTAATSMSAEVTTWPHDSCYALALSPDEKFLAVAARDLDLWELDSPRYAIRSRLLPGADDAKAYRHATFSSDGKLLAAANSQGTWTLVDPQSWTVLLHETLPAAVTALAWHATDRRLLAIATENGHVTLVSVPADVASRRAAPDFEPAKLLITAKKLVDDEEWHDCTRLIAVVSAYQLSLADRKEFDNLRFKVKKAVQELVSAVNPKATPPDEQESAALNLQLAIDLDPAGQLGKEAREKLKQLPARSLETIAKANEAAAKATAANRGRTKKARRP
jgi:WD40 repeat protein